MNLHSVGHKPVPTGESYNANKQLSLVNHFLTLLCPQVRLYARKCGFPHPGTATLTACHPDFRAEEPGRPMLADRFGSLTIFSRWIVDRTASVAFRSHRPFVAALLLLCAFLDSPVFQLPSAS